MSGSEALKLAKRAMIYSFPFSALGGALLWLGSSPSPPFLGAYCSLLYSGLGLLCGGFCVALAWTKSRCEAEKVALQARHQQLLDASPNGILETDTQGRILFANRAFHNGVGYAEGALIGLNIRDLMPKEDRSGVMARLALAGSGQAIPDPYCTRNVTKARQIIDIEIAWNRKRNATGVVTGFVSMITDIMARRKAEEMLKDSEARYPAIFEQSSDYIALITISEGQIVTFNENAHENLGYSREAFSSLNLADFDADKPHGSVQEQIRAILANGEKSVYASHRTKRGETREIKARSSALDIQGERYLLLV